MEVICNKGLEVNPETFQPKIVLTVKFTLEFLQEARAKWTEEQLALFIGGDIINAIKTRNKQ